MSAGRRGLTRDGARCNLCYMLSLSGQSVAPATPSRGRPARGRSAPGLLAAFLSGAAAAAEPTTRPAAADRDAPLALAQPQSDGPLVSDRPDFTESAVTVPAGRVQLESGYTFTYDREKKVRVRDHTFPEFLLRIGLAPDLELRVGWEGWSSTETLFRTRTDAGRPITRTDHNDGATDPYLGAKIHVLEQRGWIPELGLIPAITVPSGSRSKTSADVDPQLGIPWAYGLTDRLSVAGQLNLVVPTSDGRRFFQTSASVSLGVQITDWLGAYVEYFGFYPNDRGTDCAHYVNGGFTFPITDDLQFDVRTGAGLNEEADDFFAGAGFVIRF